MFFIENPYIWDEKTIKGESQPPAEASSVMEDFYQPEAIWANYSDLTSWPNPGIMVNV